MTIAVETETRRDKSRRLAAYGVGDFGLNIYWNTLTLFLVFFYTVVVGLDPKVAGLIYFIGMAWDAVSDPVVAGLAERVRTPRGTYLPFLFYGSPLLALAFVLLFWVPPFEGSALILVLIAVALLFRTAYTLVAIPYAALSARVTYDSMERTELAGVRMFFAFGGLLLVSLLAPKMLRAISGGNEYTDGAFLVASVAGAVVATAALYLCYALSRERPPPGGSELSHPTLRQVAHVLLRNRALLILLCIIFLQSSGNASLMVSLLFFLETQEGLASQETVLTAFAVATMVGVPLWTQIIRWTGKKIAWVLASSIMTASGLAMLVFGTLPVMAVPVPIIVYGACLGAFAVMLWSFVPDTVEYGQVQTGLRAEGVSFGAVMVSQKLAGALMGLIVGLVLARIGFDANLASQTEETRQGLFVFLSLAPGLLFLLSAVPVLMLPLSRRRHADMVSALSGRSPDTVEVPSREG